MRSLKALRKVITPYKYQRDNLNPLVRALSTYQRALIVMATGLGKTIMSILVLLRFIKPTHKVLFLCHDAGILDQTYDKYREYLGDVYPGNWQ